MPFYIFLFLTYYTTPFPIVIDPVSLLTFFESNYLRFLIFRDSVPIMYTTRADVLAAYQILNLDISYPYYTNVHLHLDISDRSLWVSRWPDGEPLAGGLLLCG